MKLKRVSERQINKDMYEQEEEEDSRFAEQPDPGQGMTRASEDVMKRRKIIKIGNRRKKTASAAPTPQPANPFASTSFASSKKVDDNDDDEESSTKPNPFANISFASNDTTAPKPTFSFGAPAPAPSAAASSAPTPAAFSFGLSGSNSSNKAATTSTSIGAASFSVSQPVSSSNGKNSEKLKQLNKNFLQMIVNHWNDGYYSQEYTGFFDQYKQIANKLLDGPSTTATSATTSASTSSKPSTTSTNTSTIPSSSSDAPKSDNASKPTQSFSFGTTPAPAPAKPFASFNFGATAPPAAGTFSFTSASPAAAAASTKPNFSFGSSAPPSTLPTPPPSSSANSTNDEDDPTSNPDDGKVETVEQEENTEEEVLIQVRAKPLKLVDKQWKKFGTGILRLYRNKKEPSKQRMVLRNEIGKVQLNLAVAKGMSFDKELKKGSKGSVAYVKFAAVESAERGVETFMLQVKPEELDKLHSTFVDMSK